MTPRLQSFQRGAKSVYHHIPDPFKIPLKPLQFLYGKFHHILWALRFDLWVIEGQAGPGSEKIVFAFAGSETAKNYQSGTLQSATETYLGKHWFWSIRPIAASRDCSLIFYEICKARKLWFPLRVRFKIPVWVKLEMDLSGPLELKIRKIKYKNIVRRIRKNSLAREIRTGLDSFNHFYHQMYVPYAKTRHQSTLVLHPYDKLKRRLPHSEMVFIKKDQELIAGNIIDFSEPQPHLVEMGLENGRQEYLSMGVSDAIYYYSFCRIKEKGYASANLGHCRAFLNDGALQSKKEFGAYIANSHILETGYLGLNFLKITPGLQQYLSANPFVSLQRGKYYLTYFPRKEQLRSAENPDFLENADSREQVRLFVPGDLNGEVENLKAKIGKNTVTKGKFILYIL